MQNNGADLDRMRVIAPAPVAKERTCAGVEVDNSLPAALTPVNVDEPLIEIDVLGP